MNEAEHRPIDDAVERVLRSADSKAGVARFGAAGQAAGATAQAGSSGKTG